MKQKNVWITGASSGIGKALALEYARYKCSLFLFGRNIAELEKVKEFCESKGATANVISLDLADEESIQNAVKAALQLNSHIDILINNGGISQRALAEHTDISVDKAVMQVNFFGTILFTKLVLAVFIKQKQGNIAVMSSLAGKFGFPLRTTYSASKHALQGFFESLRAELKPHNIKVSIISPGRVRTNISFNALTADGSKQGEMDEAIGKGLLPEKVASIIVKNIERGKAEIMIGREELVLFFIRRMCPPLFRFLVTKINPK